MRENWLRLHLALAPLGSLAITWALRIVAGDGWQWWRNSESLEGMGQVVPLGAAIYGSVIAILEGVVRMFWALAQIAKDIDRWRSEGREQGLKEGMERGREQGLVQGLERGLEQGLERGMERGLERGREQGLEQGMERGREQGLEQGMERGREQGLEQGLERGREQGLEQGLERGRKEGKEEARQELIRLLVARNIELPPEFLEGGNGQAGEPGKE